MADVVELFPYLDEEEGEEEADECDEDEDESLYWSPPFIPNLFDPVISSSRRSHSSESEESANASSDCSYFHLPVFHDSPDRTVPSSLSGPYPETLESRDFRLLDAVQDLLYEGEEVAVENQLFVGSSIDNADSSGEGLRVAGFASESDISEHESVIATTDCDRTGRSSDWEPVDVGHNLNWDFIPIEDVQRASSEEFEWEEVDDRLDDRGVLGMMIGIEDDVTSSGRGEEADAQLESVDAAGEVEDDDLIDTGSNIIWEILLAMNNHGMIRNNSGSTIEHVEDIPYFDDDQEVFFNPSDYEFQIEQFADHDNIIRGSPPASKLVVSKLPSIMLTEEDTSNNICMCAICKDAFSLKERAKQLPCSHFYHEDCILQWLGIRNTCPLCRYELLTDDPDYERLKGRAETGSAVTLETFLRSDFEFHEI